MNTISGILDEAIGGPDRAQVPGADPEDLLLLDDLLRIADPAVSK